MMNSVYWKEEACITLRKLYYPLLCIWEQTILRATEENKKSFYLNLKFLKKTNLFKKKKRQIKIWTLVTFFSYF